MSSTPFFTIDSGLNINVDSLKFKTINNGFVYLGATGSAGVKLIGTNDIASDVHISGVPTVDTATAGTNTTQIANTSFVQTAVSNLVASAPSTLNTLNELAAALGNDSNFSTTVTNLISEKVSKTGNETISGIKTFNSLPENSSVPSTNNQITNKLYVDTQIAGINIPQGATGAQGYNGITGATGAQGYNGNTGTIGAQGVPGSTGTQGVIGAQGYNGNTGTQGFIGAQGYNDGTILITNNNTNAVFYPVFVSDSGQQSLNIDNITGPFSINPNTGEMNVATTLKITTTNVGLGTDAGLTEQGTTTVAIGTSAGKTKLGAGTVVIGFQAGWTGRGVNSVAIGYQAAQSNQGGGGGSVAIGNGAGKTNQGTNSVAIGNNTCQINQSFGSVSLGYKAGNTGQANACVAIGAFAGQLNQNVGSVSIGYYAGNAGSGDSSISIGYQAATTSVLNNQITLNATGTALNGGNSSAFYVSPIRGVATATPVMVYNTGTKEITYNTSSIKYKKNVIDLTKDTSVIFNVRAREYDSKDDDTHHIGYIAEEVNEVETNFTWKNPDGTPEGIEWFNLLIMTIEEMKKLKLEKDNISAEYDELKLENDNMSAEIDEIKLIVSELNN